MRKYLARDQKIGTAERAVLSELTWCCMWEFASVSEYIYYSLMLDEEYCELSDMFEKAATSCLECFRTLGSVILALGADPALNMQIKRSRERCGASGENIERIISLAIEREKRSIAAISRIAGHCPDCDSVKKIGCVISEKSEFLTMLERMLRS